MSESAAEINLINKNTETSLNQELKQRKTSINPINDRVRKLRDESLKSKVTISSERAKTLGLEIIDSSKYNKWNEVWKIYLNLPEQQETIKLYSNK